MLDLWIPNMSPDHMLTSVGRWAVRIARQDTYIVDAIQHDKRVAVLTNDCGIYLGEQREFFEHGIDIGYDLLIDIFSKVRYERQGFQSLDNFVASPDAQVVGSAYALRAITRARRGHIAPYFPRNSDGQEAYEVLYAKAGDVAVAYNERGGNVFNCYRDIVVDAIQKSDTYSARNRGSVVNGLMCGFDHAKSMYLEGYIARSTEQLDQELIGYVRTGFDDDDPIRGFL